MIGEGIRDTFVHQTFYVEIRRHSDETHCPLVTGQDSSERLVLLINTTFQSFRLIINCFFRTFDSVSQLPVHFHLNCRYNCQC